LGEGVEATIGAEEGAAVGLSVGDADLQRSCRRGNQPTTARRARHVGSLGGAHLAVLDAMAALQVAGAVAVECLERGEGVAVQVLQTNSPSLWSQTSWTSLEE
jgi:hypothetical protein